MKIPKKKIRATAGKLLELSREATGTVSPARVNAILEELPKAFPPTSLRPLLKLFYADVARELRFTEARIEFAGTLPAGTANALAAHFSKIYNRTISAVPERNDALLAGLRVQVGDDVFDASAAGTLAKLQRALCIPA